MLMWKEFQITVCEKNGVHYSAYSVVPYRYM